eukprot:s2332_g11.t1
MAEDAASACSESPPSSLAPVDDDWRTVVPKDGDMEYVKALQLLGIHMASSVPLDLKTTAITALGGLAIRATEEDVTQLPQRWQSEDSETVMKNTVTKSLKDYMVKPASDPTPVGKGADLDAETDVMGSDEESDMSSDGIPDCFFGVVDEPQIESNDEDSDVNSDIWANDQQLAIVEDDESTGPVPDEPLVPVVSDAPGDAGEHDEECSENEGAKHVQTAMVLFQDEELGV